MIEFIRIKRGRYVGLHYFKHQCSNEGCAGAVFTLGLFFWELSVWPKRFGQYCD